MVKKGMIGLEVHTYLVTKEKLFCSCVNSRKKGTTPNINICPICTGQPGSKPMMPLEEAVFNAVQIGLVLGCEINSRMPWQRKHYDWPDLPKGYQLTLSGAHAVPLGVKGNFGDIRIRSMHLEEDPAAWDPETGEIDYNRSGIPLVEIVTEPDFKTGEEVNGWLNKLLDNLNYLGIVDSDAGIKVDVNVNIPGKSQRTEIKNLNSLENISQAIEYELERHEREGQSVKETRRFNPDTGKTEKMRTKEEADDYRFIRDPDLPDIVLDVHFINAAKNMLPEPPEKKKKTLVDKFKLSEKEAEILVKDRNIVEFYEKLAAAVETRIAYAWVSGELMRLLNNNNCVMKDTEISVEHTAALLKMIVKGELTPLKAKDIFKQFYPKSFAPDLKEQGRITDRVQLMKIVREVAAENRKIAEDYKGGKKESLNYLIGQVMKKTEKRADSNMVKEILIEILG